MTVEATEPGRVTALGEVESDAEDPREGNNREQEAVSVRAGGGSSRCTIVGTAENDVIVGTAGDDVICAGDGNDVVGARAGDDLVRGEGGNDTLRGDEGDDTLEGGAGDDVLAGGPGRDRCRRQRGHQQRLSVGRQQRGWGPDSRPRAVRPRP